VGPTDRVGETLILFAFIDFLAAEDILDFAGD